MLTKDDFKQIKQIVRGVFMPLDQKVGILEKQGTSIDLRLERVERKVDSVDLKLGEVGGKVDQLGDEVKSLKLETEGIHLILERQEDNFRQRIERLEEDAGIISSS